MYEEAYVNYQKAKAIFNAPTNFSVEGGSSFEGVEKKDKKIIAEDFFFAILEAQIFESAGRDEAALMRYYAAR
jgi:hypothetical protein